MTNPLAMTPTTMTATIPTHNNVVTSSSWKAREISHPPTANTARTTTSITHPLSCNPFRSFTSASVIAM